MITHTRKKFAIGFVAVAAAVSLAACGGVTVGNPGSGNTAQRTQRPSTAWRTLPARRWTRSLLGWPTR